MGRILVVVAAVLGIALVLVDQLGFPYREVVRDPNYTAQQPWWTGSLSSLGLVGWGMAATLFACAAWVRRTHRENSECWIFLGIGAGLFGVVGVDDALMLHDEALSRQRHVLQGVIYLGYAAVAGAWAIRFRGELRGRPLLLAAAPLFAMSVVMDVFEISDFLEDYAKYVGLAAVVLAGVQEMRTGVASLRSHVAQPRGWSGSHMAPATEAAAPEVDGADASPSPAARSAS